MLHVFWPLRIPGDAGVLPGSFLLMAGFGLVVWSIWSMQARGATPEPWKDTTVLVIQGPFRFSRNPIYLGFLLLQAGIGMVVGWWWFLIMVVPAAVVLDRWIVRREEKELEAGFGESYNNYRSRVRRWL